MSGVKCRGVRSRKSVCAMLCTIFLLLLMITLKLSLLGPSDAMFKVDLKAQFLLSKLFIAKKGNMIVRPIKLI